MATDDVSWFLPDHFEYFGRTKCMTYKEAVRNYKDTFFSVSHKCTKIYVPMNEDSLHWYLVVVRMDDNIVHMVDSMHATKSITDKRNEAIKNMLKFLYTTISYLWMDVRETALAPRIMDWKIIFPDDVAQQNNSYDCGMWVCQWMITEDYSPSYCKQYTSASMRMRLAQELIMHPSNKIWSTIEENVVKNKPKFQHIIDQYIEDERETSWETVIKIRMPSFMSDQ
ncbi:hypothetical protein LINPERPRIM_LOCUS30783 [Linum perenne]